MQRLGIKHILARSQWTRTTARTVHLMARASRWRGSPKIMLWLAVPVVSTAYVLQNTIHMDAEAKAEEETLTDSATSISFPTTLRIPSKIPLPTFTLLGVGVRTVSFLSVKVYSVGFYADLSNPTLNIPADATPEEKIEYLVRNTACVLRIIPTRNTSHSHLRDGFLRALLGRMQLSLKRGTITPDEEADAQSPIRKLKSLFPNTPLAKHTPMDILLMAPTGDRSKPRTLIIRDLGSIENDWVATEFVLAYFEGEGISPPLKKSTIERVQTLGAAQLQM